MALYHVHIQKKSYDRKTNSAGCCVIYQMSIIPLPFYATQIIYAFLNSTISANLKKRNFTQWYNSNTSYCSSSAESLVHMHTHGQRYLILDFDWIENICYIYLIGI